MVGYDRIKDIGLPAVGARSVVWSISVDQEEEARTDRRRCGGMSHDHLVFNDLRADLGFSFRHIYC